MLGETLPAATNGVFYTQNIAGQAKGGTPPYSYTLISTTGGDTWFVSLAGVITGTPVTAGNFLITETGAYLVTETGANLIT